MEVHVTPETAKKLTDLAATSGSAAEDIVEDALAGHLEEVAAVRKTLDSRYDALKSGRVRTKLPWFLINRGSAAKPKDCEVTVRPNGAFASMGVRPGDMPFAFHGNGVATMYHALMAGERGQIAEFDVVNAAPECRPR